MSNLSAGEVIAIVSLFGGVIAQTLCLAFYAGRLTSELKRIGQTLENVMPMVNQHASDIASMKAICAERHRED